MREIAQPPRRCQCLSGPRSTANRRQRQMTARTASVVSASELGLTFQTGDGPVRALSDVDLTIEKGEFVSFIGPSGCGKTTFLRVIADLEKPTEGTISVNGMTPEQAREKRAYGYVFQAAALFPVAHDRAQRRAAAGDHGPLRAEQRGAHQAHDGPRQPHRLRARNIPGSFPAACSSAPRSPARSPSTPTCC